MLNIYLTECNIRHESVYLWILPAFHVSLFQDSDCWLSIGDRLQAGHILMLSQPVRSPASQVAAKIDRLPQRWQAKFA